MMEAKGKGPNGAKSVADWERTVKGLRKQIDDPEAVAQALQIMEAMRAEIQAGIDGLIKEGYSWTELAAPCGVSRQAMRQRWGVKK